MEFLWIRHLESPSQFTNSHSNNDKPSHNILSLCCRIERVCVCVCVNDPCFWLTNFFASSSIYEAVWDDRQAQPSFTPLLKQHQSCATFTAKLTSSHWDKRKTIKVRESKNWAKMVDFDMYMWSHSHSLVTWSTFLQVPTFHHMPSHMPRSCPFRMNPFYCCIDPFFVSGFINPAIHNYCLCEQTQQEEDVFILWSSADVTQVTGYCPSWSRALWLCPCWQLGDCCTESPGCLSLTLYII